jgi:hypothetical protein
LRGISQVSAQKKTTGRGLGPYHVTTLAMP